MESCPSGNVDTEIGMVHSMETPEKRHFVEEHVLDVNDKVKEELMKISPFNYIGLAGR